MGDYERTKGCRSACRGYRVDKSACVAVTRGIRKTNGVVEETTDELTALRPTITTTVGRGGGYTTDRLFQETAVEPKVTGVKNIFIYVYIFLNL